MKTYAEDREHCLKQQNEMEILKGQLAEKDGNLQQWREERDQLVAALEIQLKALISSNVQKDNEIEQLKKITSEASKTEKQTMDIHPTQMSSTDPGRVETEPQSTSFEISRGEVEDGSVVLDSCEVSTENNQSTRFPKPELEIQFTPLQPNRMAVKHPGCTSPVTVKTPKARKRKSHEMEEDFVKFENKKNATPRINLKSPVSEHRNSFKKEQKVSIRPSSKKTYSLRSHASTVGVNGSAKKKEGTLQKFGDFLQHSPTILQSKAKKIIETMSSSKFSNVEISVMRDEEKLLRIKINELEKKKNQCSEEIDMKQRTIQQLKESEQKHEAERKKWLEEKMMLITQAKEAENLRNKEMKKYAEDREHCLKQQNEMEILKGQLAEKDGNLQQWREERDQLVAALEIQLKALISSNVQKDNEIEQLKKITSEASKTEKQTMDIHLTQMSSTDPGRVEIEPQSTSFEISRGEVEDGSVVLDSCEVSTENNQSTRFPKPELEIQFTPLQPNRMAVKHPGCTSPVTVKIPKARKRKSHEMEEDFVKFENKKNATPRINLKSPVSEHRNSFKKEQKVSIRPSSKKTYSLRSHASTVGVNGSAKKKEGTLQKFGDFLQHSPTILQSKAKKIIETMSSSKFSNVEVSKENVSRPKRAKRKLYTNEISSPIDISGQVWFESFILYTKSHKTCFKSYTIGTGYVKFVVIECKCYIDVYKCHVHLALILMDHRVKESDHQILKRRLRTRTVK
ncbi:hypothetical protein E5288_WYG009223 [Bos mutus]|uniref:Uncharacterized protein n=1 Tax=Bos mutus TaxID=72004 RepID=A0A6B0QUZ3_9CETA|nr:hypothetical protein [Bos mutus]